MSKTKLIPLLIVGAVTLVLAVGAVSYRVVYAQAATPSPETPTTPNQTRPDRAAGPRGDFRAGATDQDLADALGIDLATLQAAEQSANAAAIQQAVEQGLITQEQADQLSANGKGVFRLRGVITSSIDMNALLADALGITPDKLSAARQTAQKTALQRAVDAGTLTQEQADLIEGRSALFGNSQFQSSMQSAFEQAVQQAVTAGVITQAQADQILAQNNGQGLFGRGGFEFGFPGKGGHRGPHGGPGDLDQEKNQETTPSGSGL